MQPLLPQLSKTSKAYLEKYVQEVAQEGCSIFEAKTSNIGSMFEAKTSNI